MDRRMKIISMMLIIALVAGNLNITKVNAVQVQNEKQKKPKVKITFLNDYVDETVKEPVFKIKNKTDSVIKVKKVEFQIKQNGEWVSAGEKKGAVTDRNTKIASGKSAYDSIVLRKHYKLPKEELDSGKYSICVTYKYKGELYKARKSFVVYKPQNEEIPTGSPQSGTSGVEGAPPVTNAGAPPTVTIKGDDSSETEVNILAADPGTVINGAKVTGDADDCLLLNHDFSIGKKGKVKAMIFTEAYYYNTDKVKIKLKIQKKVGNKWKKVRKYKVTKKSSVAFANKTFKLKKSGTYRMNVEVTFYKKGKKQGRYTIKSKSQKYAKQ